MKILYITEIYPDVKHGLGVWGGGEKQFYEISKSIAKRGHEITVLTCRFPGQPSEDYIEGVRVLRAGLSRDPTTGSARKEIWPVLSYILETAHRAAVLNPDLIHCNTYFPVYSGRIASHIRHIPMIATFHDIYTIHNWIESQKSLIWGSLGHLATIGATKLHNNRIIVPSIQCKQKLINLGLPPEKVTIIPNGIDLTLFDSIDAKKNCYQILFVGRLVRLKRVDRIIYAFKEVLKDIPQAILKIVGHGPEGENLKALVKRLGLQDKIIFTGLTPTYNAVTKYFKESALFVLPSAAEGESIAVKEAMAASLPVIAMNIRGLGVLSLVREGETGFLVDPNRPSMLVEKMIDLLSDKKKRRIMGLAGRKYVENFDWQVIVDRTIQVYHETIHENIQ
ncbi:glycosyltransferase family 4 protein [[Eubacterium] cellulosolvens]